MGLLNGMDNLLSALYSFPGGYLADRLGYKKALLAFNVIALFGYAIVILFPCWPAVFVGAVFFLSWTAISLPAIMGLVSRTLPTNKRTMGVSIHSLVRRIPMAAGPLIGGLLIGMYGDIVGVRLAFVAAFVLGIGSLLLLQLMIDDDKQRRSETERNPLRLWRFMGTDLKRLLVSDILIRYAEQIPYAFVVVWCVENNSITAFRFGILTAIEMVTAMLVYIPVAYLADKFSKKPFVLVTFFNFTIFPLFLLFSRSFPMMVVAFIIRGLKEFGEPTRKALIMDLAPEDKKAGMFGLYYLIRDVIVSISAFGGAFLWRISPAANLLTATSFGLLGIIYFWIFGRDLKSA